MLVPAGRINKLFGTDGGVMLSLYTAFPNPFDPYMPLVIKDGGLEVPLYCGRFERHGATGAIATFEDIDTDRRATEFLGREFFIETGQEEQEEDGEFYMEDLIGFSVKAKDLEGEVTDYFDSEANPLFEITTQGRKVLIPAVEEFFAHIDFKRRTIKLVLPDGLIEIQQ